MDDATRADRIRIASVLMDLSVDETQKAVAAMDRQERVKLTSHINWVQEYEACDFPEGGIS